MSASVSPNAVGPGRRIRITDDGLLPRRAPSLQLAGGWVWLFAADLWPMAWDAGEMEGCGAAFGCGEFVGREMRGDGGLVDADRWFHG